MATYDQRVVITMTSACAQDFAHTLLARAGSYQLAQLPNVSWLVQKTFIRDASGNVVNTIG
ncbi:hypothetical protein [Herbaspirillum seropedicae]|uniref:hypothetical protein n=1 Tax=Herbaspirillum seropedicae TaxID=964 RepID=UPI001E5B07DE|nr:hypothetical protein [Herbaspirillum seropedicae]